ncbi:MAG: hypothetical protein KAR16_09645 [Bacteroidales bacterium]|nr:hypothetical protein [Bacteroidales bacterium]
MRVITIKSVEVLDEALQIEVHYCFGMEQHTDYVFKPRGEELYSATIVMEESDHVIKQVREATESCPGHEFILDDLDMDSNIVTTYRFKNGEVLEKKSNIS